MTNDAYLSAQAAYKIFDGKRVLTDIHASVHAGEVVGLLGANGAGKTTLIEMMMGLSPPSAGEVRLFGVDAIAAPLDAKRRVGFVPQSDELIGILKGRQYLELMASFYRTWDNALVDRLLLQWGVEGEQYIKNYSEGQRQKLAIIAALAPRPDLLVLDEPVASLDPIARRQFLQQIVEVSADECRAVVFSSHIVSDVERLANRIWVLKDGRLLWQGELDALKESVIRVHVREDAAESVRSRLRHTVSVRRVNGSGCRIVAMRAAGEDWSSLQALLGAEARVEHLGLEDIFLELHS
ncbi:MAG TPA: ABC transporter ATP-binding protein [Steroidobacteraceae bacterium]|nr:ABC transporter ATP-binding protein [Steroidobacteraceae bacterium]